MFNIKALKYLRKQKWLSQWTLAEKLRISKSAYISIENWKKSPTLDEISNISHALWVFTESLLISKSDEIDFYIEQEKNSIDRYLTIDSVSNYILTNNNINHIQIINSHIDEIKKSQWHISKDWVIQLLEHIKSEILSSK